MANTKDLFLDEELRAGGGWYELSIQVCPCANDEPINLYTEHIWKLENVEGPYDYKYNLLTPNIENIEHKGVLNLGNFAIPFMTYNIREDEQIETGFNWFDICFYTTAIERVFGSEYQMWNRNPKIPKPLDVFIKKTSKDLYRLYPFQLAMLDFEVSGCYYLNDLKENLLGDSTSSAFFVGMENYNLINEDNKRFVTKLDYCEEGETKDS